jgi:CSLREA domain-containing protein
MRASYRLTLIVFILLSLTLVQPQPARAASFTVDSTADFPDFNPGDGFCQTLNGTGVCTLRAAIMEANALSSPGGDTINLPAGIYLLTRSGFDDNAFNGDLDITSSSEVVIVGAGAESTIIDGNGSVTDDRVFEVHGLRAFFLDVTIQNGDAQGGNGGGIRSLTDLYLYDSVIRSNMAFHGGGISNEGLIFSAQRVIVTENQASGHGGGIRNEGSTLFLQSTIYNNESHNFGGGIYNEASLVLDDSTISGNRSDQIGGGLYQQSGDSTFLNATIVSNVADADNNDSADGGGIYNMVGGTVSLRNTLLANNVEFTILLPFTFPDDCFGTINSEDYNLIETTTDCTIIGASSHNIYGQDPQITALGEFGGSTPTHALMPGGPAIEGGNPFGCTNYIGTIIERDQRGMARHADGDRSGQAACDIGAYELQIETYLPITIR